MRSLWRAFLRGAGSIFDISPAPLQLPPRDDAAALRSDWEVVGKDLHESMKTVTEDDRRDLKLDLHAACSLIARVRGSLNVASHACPTCTSLRYEDIYQQRMATELEAIERKLLKFAGSDVFSCETGSA